MDPLAALFGIGCLVTLACALHSREHDRILLACVLAFAWAASNIAWLSGTFKAFSLMDALILMLCVVLFPHRMTDWRAAFTGVAALQIVLDIAFEAAGYQPYLLWAVLLNASFAAQLFLVSGGLDVWGRLFDSGGHVRG